MKKHVRVRINDQNWTYSVSQDIRRNIDPVCIHDAIKHMIFKFLAGLTQELGQEKHQKETAWAGSNEVKNDKERPTTLRQFDRPF